MRCTSIWPALGGLLAFGAPAAVSAADYYVAPDGNDGPSTPGTLAQPFASIGRAQEAVGAGDTVYFRGGVYTFSSNSAVEGIRLSKSGSSGAPIRYFAYENERPIFDFSGITTPNRIKGISVTGDWIHLKGIEIRNVRQNVTTMKESWGIHVNGGDDNVFENLDIHHIMGPGLFIEEGGNNLVLNCDSHHNYDENSYDGGPTPGENADGFGCHANAANNVFRGCRAYWNSDDGFDFINSPGVCVIEHSWAFRNGFVPETSTAIGNGAGIKAGGFTNNVPATIPRHRVLFNVSFRNRRQGFYANHHEGGIDWINNVAFDNGQRNFDMLGDEGPAPHLIRNNVAFGSGGTIHNLNPEMDSAFNSWNLNVTADADDFLSVDEAEALAPRRADGSLPNVAFMRLAEDSDLIDRGEDRGFPYRGAAPDLGAFESGEPIGSGGTGAGGASGGAGAGATGGTTATGGSGATAGGGPGVGGGVGAGGATSTGGTSSSGGAIGTGGSSFGGSSPGGSGSPGAGGASFSDPDQSVADPEGCACRTIGGERGPRLAPFALLTVAVAALRRRRRPARAAATCCR